MTQTLDRVPTVETSQFRGRYESAITDTVQLAAELIKPKNFSVLNGDFDRGVTPLRDVGRMIAAQRGAILTAYREGTIDDMAMTHPEILKQPIANLHERVLNGKRDQPVGHNFFVNATGFLEAELSWAKRLDAYLRRKYNMSLQGIAQAGGDMRWKDDLLATITDTPDRDSMITLAVYLAGRSYAGEQYLREQYGNTLEDAKAEVFETTQKIGRETGLSTDNLERVASQLYRAAFGSLDHLQGLVTSDNTGAAGDYLAGSLRVEVQFDGNVQTARLRQGADAHHVIAHELQHAASAQADKQC